MYQTVSETYTMMFMIPEKMIGGHLSPLKMVSDDQAYARVLMTCTSDVNVGYTLISVTLKPRAFSHNWNAGWLAAPPPLLKRTYKSGSK